MAECTSDFLFGEDFDALLDVLEADEEFDGYFEEAAAEVSEIPSIDR